MKHVGISTMGRVALDNDILARQHLPIVLLTYLAHAGRRDREHLANLFWPTAKKPLNSLSSTLTRIRQEAPDAIEIGTHQIASNWSTDATQMLALLQDGQVTEGLALYHGPFLDGFRLRTLGEELEQWIYETRDSIAATVANAAVEASRSLKQAGQWSAAADMAEHAVTVGGLRPVVIDNLDYLYGLLAGSTRLAAQTLRTEAESIGYALDDVELLRPPKDEAGLQHRSDFIGRTRELAELTSAAQPGTMVNVFGLGGSGKSSVAKRFLSQSRQRINDFPGGCYAITLQSERDGEVLTEAIRSALQAQAPPGRIDNIAEMVEHPTLLLIDDVVPTTAIVKVLKELNDIDGLCTVVISRVRIDAPIIETVAVRGLSTTASNTDGHSEAAQLFIQRAGRRLEVDEPGEAISTAIEQICERVSGLPLAIELTAAWLRMLPIFEIPPLFDDEEMLDQAPPGENLSLGLVIKRTWEMLATTEQQALSSLSIMREGFTRLAANEVADVRLNELTKLHDHSLIDVNESGRVTLHPLIQDFARQALAADSDRAAALALAHRGYFAAMLGEAVSELTGPQQGAALRQIRNDHRNIDAAWRALVAGQDWETIDRTVDALGTYLLRSGQLVDALRLFQLAIDEFDVEAGETFATASLHARLINHLAWVQMLVGQDAAATKQLEKGLAIVPDDDHRTHITLLRTKCAIAGNNGNIAGALEGYLVARDLASELGDERVRALLREDIGRCHSGLGNIEEAEAIHRETLDAARTLGDPHMEARSYLLLGAVTVDRDPNHALVLLDEGASLAKSHGLGHLLAYFPKDRGFAHLALGQVDAALEQFRHGIEQADEVGDLLIRLSNLAGLARAQLVAQNMDEANVAIRAATRTAIRANAWPQILGLGMSIANAAGAAQASDDLAHKLLHFCAGHPLVLAEDLAREATTVAEPADAFDPDSRLDETCERIMQLARSLTP